jgi:hypothetical protein
MMPPGPEVVAGQEGDVLPGVSTTMSWPQVGAHGSQFLHNVRMDEGGVGSLSLSWDEARDLASGERRFILARVGAADCDDVVQELVIRLMTYPPVSTDSRARKSLAHKQAQTQIAEHFRRRARSVPTVPVPPAEIEALETEPRSGDILEPYSGDRDDRVLAELENRVSSMLAAVETCPVDGHRLQCPPVVRESVAGSMPLVAARLTAPGGWAGHERRSPLDLPRRELREGQVSRRIADLSSNQRAAEKWVERVILPCFDWWVYRTIDDLDGFDATRYARTRDPGSEIWPNPLPDEWTAAQTIIRSVRTHRWMVLRHIKLVNGKWVAEKYGLKRMRALLPVHPDLEIIIRIHMPAVARVLGYGKWG